MRSLRPQYRLLFLATGLLLLPGWLVAQTGLSHIRVVRLSYVHGTVAIKRPGSTEWAKAMVNTPIQEGFELLTSTDSFAEVEFENGSTARLGEFSEINFTQLALAPSGDKLNRMAFEKGYATFHFLPQRGDVYAVQVAGTTITPRGKSEFRTDFDQNQLRVEVFDGSVEVEGSSGSQKLGKNKVLDYSAGTAQAFNIHEGIQKDSWDQWSEARDRQATLAYNESAVGMRNPIYGWSDLDAYGDWGYFPGYGLGWAPYEPFGWSPYSMGMWGMYPGFGWTWTSGEPWGWLPYHYGFWNFDSMLGWFWMPGSFDMWSPCLVNWYAGPGWVGWAPAGGACQAGSKCVTAVPTGTIQNGQPINSTNVLRVGPNIGRPMTAPPIQASRLAMLGGTPLGANMVLPGMTAGARVQAAGAARAPFAGGARQARSTPAPPTVLMGGNPETERAALTPHHSFWGRGSQSEPLRVHLGPTLGGHSATAGMEAARMGASSRVEEFGSGRRAGRAAPSGMGRGNGPTVLAHGSARGGFGGGGGGRGEGGMMSGGHSGGGGFSSSSSVSMGSSSGGHGSSGGGHH